MSSDAPSTPADVVAALKTAMRQMPSPIALVTATDPASGEHSGIAATAFLPVSMEPASMLVCVNRSAGAHGLFMAVDRFCINVLSAAQEDFLPPFSDGARRAERFISDGWRTRHGAVYLADSAANIFCDKAEVREFGTHSVIIGQVVDVILGPNDVPALWHHGRLVPLRGSQS